MRFQVEFDSFHYRIFKISDLKDCLLQILHIVLTKQPGFMSINVNPDEQSIVMRSDICPDIASIATCSTIYRLMKVDLYTPNGGIDEYGVLSELTKKLAHHKIPILLISSFNNNYVLYPLDLHPSVLKMCESSDFYTIN